LTLRSIGSVAQWNQINCNNCSDYFKKKVLLVIISLWGEVLLMA
jgi:hypothetical protein